MLNWLTRRNAIGDLPTARVVAAPPVMSGRYLLLYQYLQNRYADTVVLTFGQIESLLGFSLPDQARVNQHWWTNAEPPAAGDNYSDSWILAHRNATANLLARTVVFERAS